jgi:hypothetical protein
MAQTIITKVKWHRTFTMNIFSFLSFQGWKNIFLALFFISFIIFYLFFLTSYNLDRDENKNESNERKLQK